MRATYGDALIRQLAIDLTGRFGRGFSARNLAQMRLFYQTWPILQTASAKSSSEAALPVNRGTPRFPLPWSHYVRLLAVKNTAAREFYEAEALRGGWSVRQLDRQIESQFYERTALSDSAYHAVEFHFLLIPYARRALIPRAREQPSEQRGEWIQYERCIRLMGDSPSLRYRQEEDLSVFYDRLLDGSYPHLVQSEIVMILFD